MYFGYEKLVKSWQIRFYKIYSWVSNNKLKKYGKKTIPHFTLRSGGFAFYTLPLLRYNSKHSLNVFLPFATFIYSLHSVLCTSCIHSPYIIFCSKATYISDHIILRQKAFHNIGLIWSWKLPYFLPAPLLFYWNAPLNTFMKLKPVYNKSKK